MITERQVALYKKYEGNLDFWSLQGASNEHEELPTRVWGQIDEFISDLELVKSGNASSSFEESIVDRMNSECESTEVVEEIRSLLS